MTGIPQDKEIVLQGNYAFEMEAYLIDAFGIPKHVFEIVAAKGAKLRKK